MAILTDVLLVLSFVLFILGLAGAFIKPIKNNIKLRYIFLASVLVFSLGLAVGWESFVAGWNSCAV